MGVEANGGSRGEVPASPTSLSPARRAGGQGRGSGVEVPEPFPPLCAAVGFPALGQRVKSLGPFSRIINSSVCPDWPTEQPRPPQGPRAPSPPPSSHPSEARPPPPVRGRRVPRSVSNVLSPWQPACLHPAQAQVAGGGGCGPLKEVCWPGIEGHGSVLGLAGSLAGWKMGSCPPETSCCQGGVGQRWLRLGGLAAGCCQ